MINSKLRRISGDIFCHELHDGLNLDGLILQVRYGFNPIDAAWREYSENVNPRIDANTMVFAYNSTHIGVPTREQFPLIISAELDQMAARGCRRIATNPLWFVESAEDRVRKGGKEADRMMDDAINAWLGTGDNASRVDVIYVVDKYAKGIPSWKEVAMGLEPELFIDYLQKGFRKDVSAWFDTFVDRHQRFFPSVAVVTSDGEGILGAGPASLPFKVASMYACVLTHAAVAVTKDIDALSAMSKVLGFPLIDYLMAGYVNPMRALEVSGLLPTDQQKPEFFSLAHEVYGQVRDRVLSICEIDEPKSAAEDYVRRMMFSDVQSIFGAAESYLAAMENYLTGSSGECPGDLFPEELLRR